MSRADLLYVLRVSVSYMAVIAAALFLIRVVLA